MTERKTIHLLDVECPGCGAGVEKPCKRAIVPHRERYKARDQARAAQAAGEGVEQ